MIRFEFGKQYLVPFRPGGFTTSKARAGNSVLQNVKYYEALELDDSKGTLTAVPDSTSQAGVDVKAHLLAHHPEFAAGMFSYRDGTRDRIVSAAVSVDFKDAKYVYQVGCDVVGVSGTQVPLLIRPYVGYRLEQEGKPDTVRDSAIVLIRQYVPCQMQMLGESVAPKVTNASGARPATHVSCAQWIVDAYGSPSVADGTEVGNIPYAAWNWANNNRDNARWLNRRGVPTELVFGVRISDMYNQNGIVQSSLMNGDSNINGSLWISRNKGVDPDTIQLVA